MKITNKFNLPCAFVNLANDQREYKPKRYSVTTILSSTRQILLGIRHDDEIEQDVSDMVNMIFGTAIHNVLEAHDDENAVEIRLEHEIKDGYFLTGQFDLYNKETFTIEDYKSASVWKVIYGDFEDWRRQGLQYAWLARKNGIHVEHLKFHALLKDWSAAKSKYDKLYPEHQVWTWNYDITARDLVEIEEFIIKRFDEILYHEDKESLPLCTEEERWATATKYALMKKGRKSAIKLFDSRKEAEDYHAGDYIEVREGVDKKCDNYCSANKFCDYWRAKNGLD
jgi:hypothetical protein